MKANYKKLIGAISAALLAFIGVSAIDIPKSASAADASRFDPGLIISDAAFYDSGSMSVAQIQRFLESKLPAVCNDNDGGPKCIKNFVMDTPAVTGEDGRCASLPAKSAQTAAQIIYDVSIACNISPKTLIVTLQKEQGLIQASNPTSRMYNFALGMNCPDTPSGCAASSAGFFWQLYKGAGQLQWYGDARGSFTYLKVGTTITRRYQAANVEASIGRDCGARSFPLKSQATAALYYYTPYTPNQAALNNLYSTGDACSAYGNRNFWRFYTDWFGDPVAGSFLIKAATGYTYLVSENLKYPIYDTALISELTPLGKVGTVSQSYLDTFTTSITLNRLFKSATGQFYFFDNGKKYTFTNCAQVEQFALDCNLAATFTASQIAALANGGAITEYIPGDNGETFIIQNGLKRQVLDSTSLSAAGIAIPALSTVPISAFDKMAWGQPIARNLALFTNKTSGKKGVYVEGKFYELSDQLAKEVDFSKWFSTSTGTLSAAAIGLDNLGKLDALVKNNSGTTYIITAAGKRVVEKPEEFLATALQVPDALTSAIPDAGAAITGPLFAKSPAAATTYLVADGQKRIMPTAADRTRLASQVSSTTIQVLPQSAINQIPSGKPALGINQLVKTSASSTTYLIDGKYRAVQLIPKLALEFGQTSTRTVSAAELSGYQTRIRLSSPKISCGTSVFMASGGKLLAISNQDAASYPGKIFALTDATCAALAKNSATLGRFITTPDRAIWLVQGAKKYRLTTSAYRTLRGDRLPTVAVSAGFAATIPTATGVPTAVVDVDPTLVAVPVPLVNGGAVIAPAPSPTPSTTPSATPTASPSPSPSASSPTVPVAAAVHTVVSGEKMYDIAMRYYNTGTSTYLRHIMAANYLTSSLDIYAGQRLKIPAKELVGTLTAAVAPNYPFVVHTVVSGEKMYDIAMRYYSVGTSSYLRHIMAANYLASSLDIYPKQRLRIPAKALVGQIVNGQVPVDSSAGATPAPSVSPSPTTVPSPTASPSPTTASPTPSRVYTVVSGDTLTKIAAKYSMTLSNFVATVKTLKRGTQTINLSTTTVLWVGDVLTIP